MGFKTLLLLLLTCNLFSAERFYNVDEDLLIDSKLNIEWLMEFKETPSFTDAQLYCSETNIPNKIFRLPTMQELMSLVKYSVLSSNNFAFSGEFWSSSLDETNEKQIMVFSVTLPNGAFNTKEYNATLNTLCIHDINDTL